MCAATDGDKGGFALEGLRNGFLDGILADGVNLSGVFLKHDFAVHVELSKINLHFWLLPRVSLRSCPWRSKLS